MAMMLTYVEGGRVRTADLYGQHTIAETCDEWHKCREEGQEVEWFFVSDREGDPIAVSFQDWSLDPAWEIVYNDL